jgi:hypothetical protein
LEIFNGFVVFGGNRTRSDGLFRDRGCALKVINAFPVLDSGLDWGGFFGSDRRLRVRSWGNWNWNCWNLILDVVLFLDIMDVNPFKLLSICTALLILTLLLFILHYLYRLYLLLNHFFKILCRSINFRII